MNMIPLTEKETTYGKKFPFTEVLPILEKYGKSVETPVVTLMAMQGDDPFRVLFTTILSARTKDGTTLPAAKRLFKLGSTPNKLAKASIEQISEAIYPVGFYKTKAKNVLLAAQKIVDEFDGKVPNTLEGLLSLPGVGRKTANLVLAEAFKVPALCVDVHVHRISNRLGIMKTSTPDTTEQALAKIVPRELWIHWNPALVAYGQTLCTPQSPKCSECVIKKYCKQVGVTKRR